MKKKIIFLFLILLNFPSLRTDEIKDKKNNLISKINWQIENVEKEKNKPLWYPIYPEKIKENNDNSLKKNKFSVKSLHRSILVNDFLYPEISNYVPNAFLESSDKFVTFSLRGISKTRQCNDSNF